MNTSTSLSTDQKGHSLILLLVILFLLTIGGVLYFKPWNISSPQPQQIFCTQEAKICPDGSAVGRTGPNCEFSACPDNSSGSSSSAQTTDWKAYSNPDYNISFKYPSTLIQGTSVYNTTPSKMLVLQFYSSDKKIQFNLWTSNSRDDLKDEHGFEGVKQLSMDKIIVGGQSGTLTTYETDTTNQMSENSPPSYISEIYVVSLKDMPLDLQYSGPRDSISRQQLDQILSTFTFTDQSNNISPTPTCFPRPACLDTNPRCMMPEPVDGWCQ